MICFTDYRFNFICFFIIYANPTLLHGHTVNRVGFAVFYRFTQQNLPAWKPAMTPGCVITIFLMIGVTFVPVGLVCLHASNHVAEIAHRYDIDCVPNAYKRNRQAYIKDSSISKNCTQEVKVFL
jgi:hypothetical protein